ncbi:hypothetical protein TNCV_3451001 [Trichonephila clavipes]|uniref:Uncharacterized protein n=1 Tax=Trichonephila clavipes TaxID=2585209 RepID=A0A8X6WJP5_TRICX|nr:hypothetical protein TNCV_3451001 [Trichonephila clavipes]
MEYRRRKADMQSGERRYLEHCELTCEDIDYCAIYRIFGEPAGWRGYFVTCLLHLRLRVRPQPKSVDFQDAENPPTNS